MPKRGRTAGNAGKGSKWIWRRRRLRIYARDGWVCVYCDRKLDTSNATLDHIKPRSRCRDHRNTNLVTACMECNRARGNLSVREFAPDRWTRIVYGIARRKLPRGEDISGCSHEPETPVIDQHGVVTHWLCRCGKRWSAEEQTISSSAVFGVGPPINDHES